MKDCRIEIDELELSAMHGRERLKVANMKKMLTVVLSPQVECLTYHRSEKEHVGRKTEQKKKSKLGNKCRVKKLQKI